MHACCFAAFAYALLLCEKRRTVSCLLLYCLHSCLLCLSNKCFDNKQLVRAKPAASRALFFAKSNTLSQVCNCAHLFSYGVSKMAAPYNTAGWSVHKGVKKPRYANNGSKGRGGVLYANSHSDIYLWDLPELMSESDATAWVEAQDPNTSHYYAPDPNLPVVRSTGRSVALPNAENSVRRPQQTAGGGGSGIRLLVDNPPAILTPWQYLAEDIQQAERTINSYNETIVRYEEAIAKYRVGIPVLERHIATLRSRQEEFGEDEGKPAAAVEQEAEAPVIDVDTPEGKEKLQALLPDVQPVMSEAEMAAQEMAALEAAWKLANPRKKMGRYFETEDKWHARFVADAQKELKAA